MEFQISFSQSRIFTHNVGTKDSKSNVLVKWLCLPSYPLYTGAGTVAELRRDLKVSWYTKDKVTVASLKIFYPHVRWLEQLKYLGQYRCNSGGDGNAHTHKIFAGETSSGAANRDL